MNRLHSQTKSGARVADVLSADAGKRGIELDFMQRINALLFRATKSGLERADRQATVAIQAADTHDRIESPIYAKMARELEKTVPTAKGFGRFRE
jgi:hypothetical protein